MIVFFLLFTAATSGANPLASKNTSFDVLEISDYFETAGQNLFELNVLPEYELEQYVLPALSEDKDNAEGRNKSGGSVNGTLLYRMPAGPKSPRDYKKAVALIQDGILCDSKPCELNKPQMAIAYILVDQGYDVWLGVRNTSLELVNKLDEAEEREELEPLAQFIFTSTHQEELTVMGHFNGSVRIFGISTHHLNKSQSKISKLIDKLPGGKTVKKWYEKCKSYVKNVADKYNNMVKGINQRIDYIVDESSARAIQLQDKVLKSWGIMKNYVGPTFVVEDFSKMINHPDVYLNTPQLIKKYGYEPETHEVETEDGYLLTLHRITNGPEQSKKNGKPVVLLQHGILSSSADWVIMGPSHSLGYYLCDEGFDVWMGNSRGNVYSKAHKTMSPKDKEFWDFSWHEMGVHDLPATIDYILSTTGQRQLFYIGHSQGSTSLFVMLSEKPEYNGKIAKMVSYAPIAYAGNMRSPVIGLFGRISTSLYYFLRYLHVYEFLPTNALLTKIGRDTCEARSIYQVVCSNTLFMMTGYDTEQLNKTMVPVILSHVPAGSSIKQLVHYGQEFTSKKFRKFDYSIPMVNKEKYGQLEPPEYKINNTKIPMAIFYAGNDLLADYKDIERLVEQLPKVELYYKVPLEQFNHIDFLYAIDAPKLIYRPTIEYLRNSTVNRNSLL